METCKYGSGADKRKPTAVKRKGVVYRAYKSRTTCWPKDSTRWPTSIPQNTASHDEKRNTAIGRERYVARPDRYESHRYDRI